jgi:hypothetical protein
MSKIIKIYKDNVEHGTSSIGVLNIEAPPGKGSSAVRILGNSFSPLQPFRK